MQEISFFKLLFGGNEGYICLAFLRKGNFTERYFHYPTQAEEIHTAIDEMSAIHNVYFCAQLLGSKSRTKETVQTCTAAWADLDTCNPDNLLVKPSIVVESSPGRWQAYWVFEDIVDPFEAEGLCRRIAYYHAYQGCDRSGWDLTQLLRVPFTPNHKYLPAPMVVIQDATRAKYRLSDFDGYPTIAKAAPDEFPFPTDFGKVTSTDVFERYAEQLPVHAQDYFMKEPSGDWSKPLWALEMLCFEASMTREEVYIVCTDAACNKYKRDGKDPKNLWNEVCKAFVRNKENRLLLKPPPDPTTTLLTEAERESLNDTTTFVDRYIAWASSLGDAAIQYHQAGAFVILSALLSGRVTLPTSFGSIKPNVWFMLLADTTLTRKSTAMDIAMDLLMEVDTEPLLATDGSIEGLMGGLSTRPGIPSIFLRDEFSGFLEQLAKKDYYAGMAETLTKLYDGKIQKRMLRKETIEIRDPTFILFAGGIKNKVCSLLTAEMVSSGFVPRFVFITAESNTDNIREMGPPSTSDTSVRESLLNEMRLMSKHYKGDARMNVGPINKGKADVTMDFGAPYKAILTDEAWTRYNRLERDMMNIGLRADKADLMTPTYDRLCKTGLRIAVLIAASETLVEWGVPVKVCLSHILTAIRYLEEWKLYTDDVISRVGTSTYERLLERILNMIKRSPGVARSAVMQNYHLTSRDANLIFQTLEERGQIISRKQGKATTYTPNG